MIVRFQRCESTTLREWLRGKSVIVRQADSGEMKVCVDGFRSGWAHTLEGALRSLVLVLCERGFDQVKYYYRDDELEAAIMAAMPEASKP